MFKDPLLIEGPCSSIEGPCSCSICACCLNKQNFQQNALSNRAHQTYKFGDIISTVKCSQLALISNVSLRIRQIILQVMCDACRNRRAVHALECIDVRNSNTRFRHPADRTNRLVNGAIRTLVLLVVTSARDVADLNQSRSI